ncbi:MAG: MBL fold metallo-hydrolase [Mesorhizobium sp.]|nr:MAG: MBL fold metallo-hydrolase [Mesorhizobium sp.]
MRLQVMKSTVGEIELFQIVELQQIGPQLTRLLPYATPAELRKISWLKQPYVADDYSINGIVQSFIARIGSRVALIDTCVGNDKKRPDHPTWTNMKNDFLGALDSVDVNRFDVTDVLCTHMHMDHVGWNTILQDGKWVPTFPNARYYYSRTEFEYWETNHGKEAIGPDANECYADSILPIVRAGLSTLVDDRADLGDGLSFIPTPGHTKGHVSVVITSGADKLIVTGDCVHHPCQFARPDWSATADYDKAQSRQTRMDLFCDAAEDGAVVVGSHFNIPSMGRIEKDADGSFVFKPL